MYKVIGGDQQQYGPVTADEVRHWIADGRLSAQSLAWAEGATEWKPLSSFSEFAEALRAKAPAYVGGVTAILPVTDPTRPKLRIGHCLTRSWTLWRANFGLLTGACLVYGLISMCKLVPGVGLIYFIFKGVLEGGLFLVFLKCIRGQSATTADVFAGFRISFAQLILAGVVSGILSVIGLCCCALPGIYLAIGWTFGVPLVIDKGLEFWSALELSRKTVTRVWFETLGLILLAYLPCILASILIYGIAEAVSSDDTATTLQRILTSSHPDINELINVFWTMYIKGLFTNLLVRIMVILNLPFAVGATMYAYEDLFGSRRTPSA